MIKRLALAIGLIGLSLSLFTAAKAQAASGITISPDIEQLTASPSQNSIGFNITLTNNTNVSVSVGLTTNDFTALNDNGAVSFYTKDYNSSLNPHGLAYWISLGSGQVGLSPGQSATIPITINNLSAQAVGGHYGAVLYHVSYVATSGAAQAQISNNQDLSTLIFLTTAGEGTQNVSLTSPLVSSLYLHPPKDVEFILANNGNTQTTPRGYVSDDINNRVMGRGLLNPGSGLILPNSSRLINVQLTQEHHSFFGGIYHLSFYYRADSASTYQVYGKSFLVITPFWLWLVFVGLPLVVIIRVNRKEIKQLIPKAKSFKKRPRT